MFKGKFGYYLLPVLPISQALSGIAFVCLQHCQLFFADKFQK